MPDPNYILTFAQTISMNRPILSLLLFIFSLSAYSQVSPAIKVTAIPRVYEDYFGRSVAIDGPFAVVGATNFLIDGDPGSVIVFERDAGGNWNELQTLIPSDHQPGDHFGMFTAISGNYLAIGSWGADLVGPDSTLTNAGAVYIFEKQPSGLWAETAKITAPDARSKDFFSRVALSGRFLAIGSYSSLDEQGANFVNKAGAVYVYERTDGGAWLPVQKLTASDRSTPEAYFAMVAIDGNTLAVGAPGARTDAAGGNALPNAGAVYVFKRSPSGTWNEVQKMTSVIRQYQTQFGMDVDISGNTLLVGTYSDDTNENGMQHMNGAGSAYLFESNGAGVWSQVKKLLAPDRHDNDRFGTSVSLSGHYALVGAYQGMTDESGGDFLPASGAAYLYEKAGTTWSFKKKLIAFDRSQNDEFGNDVSISGGQLIIGAQRDDDDLEGWMTGSQGAAYIFTIVNPLGMEETDLFSVNAYPNPTGGNLTVTGCESLTELTFTLRDVSGKLLDKRITPPSETISYQIDQPEGLYFLEISSGNYSVVKKVLVY